MKRILLAVAFALSSSSVATAAPDYGDDCEKVRGTITCLDPVANDHANEDNNSQPVTTTSRGNLTNKRECAGPGNSTAGC